MADEPPPQYVDYPRPASARDLSADCNREFTLSWALVVAGVYLTPIVGLCGLILINRAIRKGCHGARQARTIQLIIIFISSIWWTLEVLNAWGWARNLCAKWF